MEESFWPMILAALPMSQHFVVPEAVTFEQAIALTQFLLEQIEQSQVAAATVTTVVQDLVQSRNGARGFFVSYLTDERPQEQAIVDAVVAGLAAGSVAIVAELLVKNLAMSTAMSLTHQRQQHPELAQQSIQVQQRTQQLIQQFNSPAVLAQGQQLWQSLTQNTGDYLEFLRLWGYDQEQLLAIQQILLQTLPEVSQQVESTSD